MTARNLLLSAPPFAVETALAQLGSRLRTARLRRNLTIAEVGLKIGAGARAIRDAEHGKPSTTMAVYAALLWAYDLLPDLHGVADLAKDEVGMALAQRDARLRAREPRQQDLDNDF